VGQADIGPPTTTSCAIVSRQVFSLQELSPERTLFIGDTSPSSVPEKLTRSIISLSDATANDSQVTILNTDGWVRENAAIAHKLELLERIGPSLVLGLSLHDELDPILKRARFPSKRLDPSKFARTRTRQERRIAREEGYRRFFRNSRDVELRLHQIRLTTFNIPKQQRIDQASAHKGTIVGLHDADARFLALGRVLQMGGGILRIRTNASETPRAVELGAVVLSSTYSEIGLES